MYCNFLLQGDHQLNANEFQNFFRRILEMPEIDAVYHKYVWSHP